MASDRTRRADGERTHAVILDTATKLASIEGVHSLTIGRLADQTGISKSGLYAHFGSKEQLQLEVIEAAGAIQEREVVQPALEQPEGIRRLEAMLENFFSYVERWVFPGGCFFSGLLAEADARSGPIHDLAAARQMESSLGWAGLVREAQETGELSDKADPDQIGFELEGAINQANYMFVLMRDPDALERGRIAVRRIIDSARAKPKKR
jgi:AcrR family transcriptional regulator